MGLLSIDVQLRIVLSVAVAWSQKPRSRVRSTPRW